MLLKTFLKARLTLTVKGMTCLLKVELTWQLQTLTLYFVREGRAHLCNQCRINMTVDGTQYR